MSYDLKQEKEKTCYFIKIDWNLLFFFFQKSIKIVNK
jgi:hypothetical protein